MASLQSLRTDTLALRDLRLASPRPLSPPGVLTPTLRAQTPPHPGYEFSWGQLIEWPGDLPDPDTENYSGTRWSIIPISVWQAIHPSLLEVRWHLHHLLKYARFDNADCVEWTLPPFVYLDTSQRVSLAGFLTLSGADAAEARRWLVESFLVEDLAGVLAHYEEQLVWWIEEVGQYRKDLKDAIRREGTRP